MNIDDTQEFVTYITKTMKCLLFDPDHYLRVVHIKDCRLITCYNNKDQFVAHMHADDLKFYKEVVGNMFLLKKEYQELLQTISSMEKM